MNYELGYFTKEECEKIINLNKVYKDYGFRYEWYTKTYDKNNRKDINGLISFQAFLIPNDENTKWIFDRVQNFFEKVTGIKFKIPINVCQLYNYGVGDKFPKHIDLNATFPKRRWNLGVQLNEDYEGGEYLCWNGLNENDSVKFIPKNTGTICGYHSRQLHEIKEITSGNRWSLVFKVESDFINEKKSII